MVFVVQNASVWLCPLFSTASAHAVAFHVAQMPDATDDGPGSAERPWRTVTRAAAAMQPGDTAVIHAGVYREGVAPARSGTPEAPIRYVGAP